jgi:HAMP domain-containing protein
MKNRLSSLPLQLLVFVVLPLLALLMIVAFGGVALHQSEMREMLVDHNRQVVAGAAASLSEQLAQRQTALSELIAAVENDEQAQAVLEQSDWLRVFFDGGVALYAADGQLLAALPPVPDVSILRAWDTRWAEAPFFPIYEPGQMAVQVVITTPPQPVGIRAAGLVSLDNLSAFKILSGLHAVRSTEAYILGADGTALYHSDPAYIGQRFEAAITRADTATEEYTDAKGREVVTTAAPIPAAGWTLVQEERWKETLGPLMRYSQAAPLALVPGLLIAIGAVWFGIRRIVYPLRRLENQATELAWGDFTAIKPLVGGIEEIQRLQATLQHMAQRVQAAQATMHNYIGAITHAQEDERRRLARELHDQTLQALVALITASKCLSRTEDDPARQGCPIRLSGIVNDLRRSERAAARLSRARSRPALEMLARDLRLTLDDGSFEKTGTHRLSPNTKWRCIASRERLITGRHSGAAQLWLTVRFEETAALVSVRDNGRGFRQASRRRTERIWSEALRLIGCTSAALIGAHLQVIQNRARHWLR